MGSSSTTINALQRVIATPSLANARDLENILRQSGCSSTLFGRMNQKSSIDAAAESDRGVVERIANAFDASLTAARVLAGIPHSDPSLQPRPAAQRFLNPDTDNCRWEPQHPKINFDKPSVQFWSDDNTESLRFRKYRSPEGLVTVLVQDTSLGISRDRMVDTILNLNSDDKLKTFEAIGQFGHGGSSALAFCELCLVLTSPRFGKSLDEFFWTLIFPEAQEGPSKQSVVRKWFCSGDGLPLADNKDVLPMLTSSFPGTSVWHFGYVRGTWLKTAAGAHQDTPAARLGRLFFSFPLPCEIRGELARGDTPTGARTVKGAYYRLLEERPGKNRVVEYRTGEKSETLYVDGVEYGRFSVFVFVLNDRKLVRNYVDNQHPVIITLNGQNHGEMTAKLLSDANFPELASTSIAEIRLDRLDEEALSNIVNNSREQPKNSPFTRALVARVRDILSEDESLLEIERRRQDEKAQQSSDALNEKITRFLAAILSDAAAEPATESGGDAPGKKRKKRKTPHQPRPEVAACDPPKIFEFLYPTPVFVPEGATKILKFKSDARPPKYSFHGDNQRCFARLRGSGTRLPQVSISGKADIDGRGYGSVTVSCTETPKNSIERDELVGQVEIMLQTTDGRTLTSVLDVGVAPKPHERERKRRQSVRPEIIFCAPDRADRDYLASLFGEEKIASFSAYLEKYRDALSVPDSHCAYWGESADRTGESWLIVEINIAHPRLVSMMKNCATAEERVALKERIVEDIVLDCYQHTFRLDDVPDIVHEQVLTQPGNEGRASEICLNFDKAIRMARLASTLEPV
jgi:hypothetical protein